MTNTCRKFIVVFKTVFIFSVRALKAQIFLVEPKGNRFDSNVITGERKRLARIQRHDIEGQTAGYLIYILT